jgi:hypothetical protein
LRAFTKSVLSLSRLAFAVSIWDWLPGLLKTPLAAVILSWKAFHTAGLTQGFPTGTSAPVPAALCPVWLRTASAWAILVPSRSLARGGPPGLLPPPPQARVNSAKATATALPKNKAFSLFI